TNISFTATPTNGGTSPSYQWKLNGSNITGATSSGYSSSSLNNGDAVSVVMTSNIGCATGSPSNSTPITMNITPTVSPTAVIASVPVIPRAGNAVTFSSVTTNGGSSPGYQWYKNGTAIGGATSSSYYVASATVADQYSLKLTSNAGCLSAPAIMSNYISIFATLPVIIESFTLSVNEDDVLLSWITTSESGNKDFIIQRAVSPYNQFQTIGTTPAKNLPAGSAYQFTDKPGIAGVYEYRLIQEDIDGNQTIIGTKLASISAANTWSISDLQSAWQIRSESVLNYQLMDIDGRILESGTVNGVKVITKPLASSIYLIRINCNGQMKIQKLIK
ncbi:MAG: T9SS type A sorting domain-containing protein, partial [Bacteroidota bacterium]